MINERPNDIPICPYCKNKLSPSGGTLDGSILYFTCWDCNYNLEDIPVEIIEVDEGLRIDYD